MITDSSPGAGADDGPKENALGLRMSGGIFVFSENELDLYEEEPMVFDTDVNV